jgi:hypothetical protein
MLRFLSCLRWQVSLNVCTFMSTVFNARAKCLLKVNEYNAIRRNRNKERQKETSVYLTMSSISAITRRRCQMNTMYTWRIGGMIERRENGFLGNNVVAVSFFQSQKSTWKWQRQIGLTFSKSTHGTGVLQIQTLNWLTPLRTSSYVVPCVVGQ